jgi:hypothetical protein
MDDEPQLDFNALLEAVSEPAAPVVEHRRRRGCNFDDDSHCTGCIEYCGMRVNFEVRDDALIVTQTDETLDPRYVARMRPLVALEQECRAAERAVNTEKHRRWKR